MQFVALASSLLFASSLTLTFADAAFSGFDGTEIASAAGRDRQTLGYGKDTAQNLRWYCSSTVVDGRKAARTTRPGEPRRPISPRLATTSPR
jgi:hypothetical protein